jgi:hypothetical protein
MTWLLARQHTPIELPDERLTPAEAIIISRSGHTEESWYRLTPQQRADIRWRIGIGGAA